MAVAKTPNQESLMPLFGRSDRDPYGPNGAWVREFLDIASSLTRDEVGRVEETAVRSGFASSRALHMAIALLVNAGIVIDLDRQRGAAQKAGSRAIGRCPAAEGHVMVNYAAGLIAEAFVVRGALDPKTWSYVTEPWRTIFEIPALYEGDEPAAVTKARLSRQKVEGA